MESSSVLASSRRSRRHFGTVLSANSPSRIVKGQGHNIEKQHEQAVKSYKDNSISRYKVVFEQGSIGLQLEPGILPQDGFPCCRVQRFIDDGPNNPGPARASGCIRPGDVVVAINNSPVKTYEQTIAILQQSTNRREITFQSAWNHVSNTNDEGHEQGLPTPNKSNSSETNTFHGILKAPPQFSGILRTMMEATSPDLTPVLNDPQRPRSKSLEEISETLVPEKEPQSPLSSARKSSPLDIKEQNFRSTGKSIINSSHKQVAFQPETPSVVPPSPDEEEKPTPSSRSSSHNAVQQYAFSPMLLPPSTPRSSASDNDDDDDDDTTSSPGEFFARMMEHKSSSDELVSPLSDFRSLERSALVSDDTHSFSGMDGAGESDFDSQQNGITPELAEKSSSVDTNKRLLEAEYADKSNDNSSAAKPTTMEYGNDRTPNIEYERAQLRRQHHELRSSFEDVREEKQKFEQMSAENAELKEKLENLKMECASMCMQMQLSEERRRADASKGEDLEAVLKEAVEARGNLAFDLKSTRFLVLSKDQELQNVQKEKAELTFVLEETRRALDRTASQLETSQVSRNRSEEEDIQIARDLMEAKKCVENSLTERAILQESLDATQKELLEARRCIESLKSQDSQANDSMQKELDSLRSAAREKEEVLRTLQIEKDDSQQQLDSMLETFRHQEADIEKWKKEAEALRNELQQAEEDSRQSKHDAGHREEQMRSELERAQKNIKSAQQMLEQLESEYVAFQAEREKSVQELEQRLKKAEEDARSEIRSLREALEQKDVDAIAQMEAKLSMEAEIDQLEKTSKKAHDDIQRLRESLEISMSDSETKLREANQKILELTQANDKAQREISSLRTELERSEHEANSSTKDSDEVHQKLQHAFHQSQQEIGSLRDKLAQKAQELEASASASERATRELKVEAENARRTIESLQDTLNKTSAEAKKRVSKSERRICELETLLRNNDDNAQQEIKSFREALGQEESRVQSLLDERNKLVEINETLQGALDELAEQRDKLNEELSNARQCMKENSSPSGGDVEQLEQELFTLHEENSRLVERSEYFRLNLEQRTNDLATVTSDLKKLQARSIEVENKLIECSVALQSELSEKEHELLLLNDEINTLRETMMAAEGKSSTSGAPGSLESMPHSTTRSSEPSLVTAPQTELADSRAEIKVLSRKIRSLESTIAVLEQEKEDLASTKRQLSLDFSSYRQKLEDVELQLLARKTDAELEQGILEELQEKLSSKEDELENLRRSAAAAKKQYDEIDTRLAEFMDMARQEKESLASELIQSQEEAAKLKRRNKDVETILRSMRRNLSQSEERATAARDKLAAERDAMQAARKAREEERNELQKKIEEMDKKLEKSIGDTVMMTAKNDSLSHEVTSLKEQLKAATIKEQSLDQELVQALESKKKVENRIGEIEAKIQETSSLCESYKRSLESARSANYDLEKELAEQVRLGDSLSATILNMRDDAEASARVAGEMMDCLKEEIRQLTATIKTAEAEKQSLATNLGSKELDLLAVTKQLEEKAASLETHSVQLNELSLCLSATTAELERTRAALETIQATSALERETSSNESLDLRKTLAGLETEIEGLRKKVCENHKREQGLLESLEVAERSSLRNEKLRVETVAKLSEASKVVASQKATIARLETEVRDLRETIRKIETASEVAGEDRLVRSQERQKRLSQLSREHDKLAGECSALRADLSHSKRLLEETDRSNGALRKRVDQLKESLGQANENIRSLRLEKDDLQTVASDCRREVESKQMKIDHLEARNQVLNATIARLKSDTLLRGESRQRPNRYGSQENVELIAQLQSHIKEQETKLMFLKKGSAKVGAAEREFAGEMITELEKQITSMSPLLEKSYIASRFSALDLAAPADAVPNDLLPALSDVLSTMKETIEKKALELEQLNRRPAQDLLLATPSDKKLRLISANAKGVLHDMRELLHSPENKDAETVSVDPEYLRKVISSLESQIDGLLVDLKSTNDALRAKDQLFANMEELLSDLEKQKDDLERKLELDASSQHSSGTGCNPTKAGSEAWKETQVSFASYLIDRFAQGRDLQRVISGFRRWKSKTSSSRARAIKQDDIRASELSRELQASREKLSMLRELRRRRLAQSFHTSTPKNCQNIV